MMRRRRNLIRVFILARGCFIYKHVLSGPHAKEEETVVARYENLDLDSGACKQWTLTGGRRTEL
jgi:hypothetical protein